MLPERIAKRIEVADCWTWTGARKPSGYGNTYWEGATWVTHRLVWTLLVGDIDPGLHIDHLCGQPSCVNPDHLQPVTPQVNHSRQHHHRPPPTKHCDTHGDLSLVGKLDGQCRRCRLDYRAAWARRRRADGTATG
jgi:hypothetical protein